MSIYLYCRSQEVASSVAQPFAAFLSFLPFSFFPLFFFSFLRRFSSNTLFIHSIEKWGLRSITSKSNASFPMCTFLRSLMYLFLSHACPLSYTLRETYIYTHDARLLASVFSLSILFLPFSNTFLPNQDNKLFLFLRFDTLNDCEFFFLLLRVTLSPRLLCDLLFSIFQLCPVLSTFRFFLISQVCTEIEFPTGP